MFLSPSSCSVLFVSATFFFCLFFSQDSNVVMSSSSSKLLNGLEQTGKITVFSGDESTTNGFMNQNGDDRSVSFILDIDGFDRDIITPNSRFTKSLSRKGSGLEKKTNEIVVTTCSPRGANEIERVISEVEVSSYVGELLLDFRDPDEISEEIALLHSLATMIYVDVKFTRIDAFESTPGSRIFELLNIPLYHGWVVNSQECKDLGFDTIELNDGSFGVPEDTLLRFVRLIKSAGLRAKPQFGVKFNKADIQVA